MGKQHAPFNQVIILAIGAEDEHIDELVEELGKLERVVGPIDNRLICGLVVLTDGPQFESKEFGGICTHTCTCVKRPRRDPWDEASTSAYSRGRC